MNHLSVERVNLLRQNARGVVRELGLLNDAYYDIGVTLAERHLLIELNTLQYPAIGEIAARLLLDKSTASRLIAKAVKKGYVDYALNEKDKRIRYLILTPAGKKTLNAFEPIAFDQTKEALLTLSPEEIETVHKGMTLYAQGLKNARIQKNVTIGRMTKKAIPAVAHLLADLRKGIPASETVSHHERGSHKINLELFCSKGHTYLLMKIGSKLIGGGGIASHSSENPPACILTAFVLLPEFRGYGLEKLLIVQCLEEAKRLGYSKCCVDISQEKLIPLDLFKHLGFHSDKNAMEDVSYLWKRCQK